MPIFPELAPLLDERFAEAEEGDEHVLPMLIGRTDASFRKTLQRAIKRAGVEPWPRLWHNMRATRQTELEDQFPSHVVCAWLGNSKPVAMKHYLQVTDAHFQKAAQPVHESGCQPMTAKQEPPQLSGNNAPDSAGQLVNTRSAVGEGLVIAGMTGAERAYGDAELSAARYVAAVRKFADTVLDHGRDHYGSQPTPLFVDGLHATTLEPAIWKGDGCEDWVLSNFC